MSRLGTILWGTAVFGVVGMLALLVVQSRKPPPPVATLPQGSLASRQPDEADPPSIPPSNDESSRGRVLPPNTNSLPRARPIPTPRALEEANPLNEDPGSVTRRLTGSTGEGSLPQRMKSANLLYDKGDYDGAVEVALEVLDHEPSNSRMLRVIVSAACVQGEEDKARLYAARLTTVDKNQMTKRCAKYGISL